MRKFMAYRFRTLAPLTLAYAALMAVAAVFSSAFYFPHAMGRQEGLEAFRQTCPLAAEILGMRLSVTGQEHILSSLYGALVPALSLGYVYGAVKRLQAEPVRTGEVFWFLNAGRSPARAVAAHFAVIWAGLLLVQAAVPLAALAPLAFRPAWSADVLQLGAAALGTALFFALPLGMLLWEAAGCGKDGMGRRVPALWLVFLLLRLAANAREVPAWLGFTTPFSLLNAWGLARWQPEAALMALAAFALGCLVALAAMARFAAREFRD